MTAIDIEACKVWIGRSTEEVDLITPRLLAEYRMTFDPFLADVPGLEVPLGFHWCLSPLLAPMRELGPDGHPEKGGFLPPVPLPRRMWAGGAIDYHGDLRPGDQVRRRSIIASIDLKQGRSGPLCFVGVRHDYLTARGLAISELQNIVYREAPSAEKNDAAPAVAADVAGTIDALESCWTVNPTPTMLFRYSAVTFNGHRIHYDYPYATAKEGYPALVVNGGIASVMLLELFRTAAAREPRSVTARNVAPLFCGRPLHLRGARDGTSWTLWAEDDDNKVALEALVE